MCLNPLEVTKNSGASGDLRPPGQGFAMDPLGAMAAPLTPSLLVQFPPPYTEILDPPLLVQI